MNLVNENFLELQDSYLFSTIAKKVAKYTKENPYRGEYDTFNDKPIKAKPIRHKPGDEFTTKYLNKDLKTVDMEVKYRWIDDNEYEVVEVKKFSQNETK